MKEMKKILAFFLCFVMVLGFVPASAFAARAEEVEAASETQTNTALYNALAEAKSFIDALTINNSSNDPATVVSTWGKFFSWDNEKRESDSKKYLYEWSYYNGVVFEGLDYVAEVTGDTKYSDYVAEYLATMIPSTDSTTWSKTTNNTSKEAAGYVSYHGVDCYKTASLLLDYGYEAMATELYGHLQDHQANYTDSDKGGNYWHSWSGGSRPTYTVWLDGLYMVQPFMAEYAAANNDTAELDRIAARFAWIGDNMVNESNGLYYHAANSSTSYHARHWGRAIGWYAAAMVDVMDHMSGDNLAAMQAQLKTLVDGMKAYQLDDGMWRNFVNETSAVKETSVTALVGYAIMKAVNKGWLDASYADMATKAFTGICDYSLDESGLHYICMKGSTSGYSTVNYNDYTNEGKGVGPFIMLYAEMLEYALKLDRITVTAPTKTEYEVGEVLDLTGMTVTGYDRLGQEIPVTGGYTVSGVDMTTAGTKTVTVTYYNCTASFEITVKEAPTTEPTEPETSEPVEAEIEYILVEGTTAYAVGDELTFSMLKAFCDDGSSVSLIDEHGYPVDDVVINGTYDMNAEGMYSVTATYEGVTSNTYHFTVSAPETLAGNESVSISGSSVGITDVTIAENKDIDLESMKNALGFADHVAYDLSGVFKTPGFKATVTLTVPEEWRDGNVAVYHVDGDKYTKYADVDNDPATYTFVTSHFSTWVQTYNARVISNTNTGTGALVGGTIYTLDTNGVTPNKDYLIVSGNSGQVSALTNNNSSTPGSTTVTISDSGTNKTITVTDDSKIAWQFSDNESGTVGNNGRYVVPGNGSLSLNTSGTDLEVDSQGDGSYKLWYSARSGFTTYYYTLRYSGGWTGYRQRSSAANYYVYLFEKTGESAGEDVTFTVTPANATIAPNGTVELTGTVTVGSNTYGLNDCTITWASSDTTKATVSNGTVTGVADGSANITATLSTVDGTAVADGGITVTIPVTVASKKIVGYELMGNDPIDVTLNEYPKYDNIKYVATYEDGDTAELNITFGECDTTTSGKKTVEIFYNGTKVGEVVVNVTVDFSKLPVADMDKAPQYPNDGAVRIDKTATHNAEEFNRTGVTHVELDVAGISVEAAVDVILIMDISNSMAWDDVAQEFTDTYTPENPNERLNIAKESAKAFVAELMKDNGDDDPNTVDNTLTMLAFAGIDGDYNDHSTASANDDVYQIGNLAMSSVSEAEAALDQLRKAYTGGTNYDYAFQQAYALAEQLHNSRGNRVYIVFMTDGVPTHYNGVYYKSRNNTDLTALMNYVDPVTGNESRYTSTGNDRNGNDIDSTATTEITYYPNYGTETATKRVTYNKGWSDYVMNNKNGWAEKVKALDYVAHVYAIGFGMKNGSVTQGATDAMPNAAGGQYYIPSFVTHTTLQHIATDANSHFEADDVESLSNLYRTIATQIKFAGTEAVVHDTVGGNFSVQMLPYVVDNNGNPIALETPPSITVKTYDLYPRGSKDDEGNDITGARTGDSDEIEGVTFAEVNGKLEAYSSVIGEDVNILTVNADGSMVINAKYFTYTKSADSVEEFVWNIGNITDKEIALAFDAYLEGSMSGERPENIYYTNEEAMLEYVDINGQYAKKTFPIPGVKWGGASTTIRFYLVDHEGNPVNRDGDIVPWANRVYVGDPVLVDIILNADMTIEAQTIEAAAHVPSGFFLYDNNAYYTVQTTSSDDAIVGGITVSEPSDDAKKTTGTGADAVTQTGAQTTRVIAFEDPYYTWSYVGFGVRWDLTAEKTEYVLEPDTVVIDFGLPVQVDVLANDPIRDSHNRELAGFAKYTAGTDLSYVQQNPGSPTYTAENGTFSIVDGKVQFTLNTMISDVQRVFYTATYTEKTNEENSYHVWGQLNIIPATTVYYEDEFVDLKTYTRPDTSTTAYTETPGWPTDSQKADGVQHEDRPGVDRSYIYGYDDAYDSCSEYSMGSAAKISVNANQYGTAEFSFYGTGFDVIALTSNTTGTLIVQVFNEDGTVAKTASVDTYYGYTYGIYEVTYTLNEDGKWEQTAIGEALPADSTEKVYDSKDELTKENRTENEDGSVTATGYIKVWKAVENDPNALYQVPVMKISGLEYGKYTAKISALYYSSLDHTTGTDGYDLYLDAIRIYDPAGTNKEANDAYIKDGEGYPQYIELRNQVIQDSGATVTQISMGRYQVTMAEGKATLDGIMFIDSNPANTKVADYIKCGPNNELYLAKNQSIAFNLNLPANVADVQIGLKLANGEDGVASYQIYNALSSGAQANLVSGDIRTATDMYYSIAKLTSGTVVISNSGDGILSITNIKITYTEKPSEPATSNLFSIDGESATNAVNSLSYVMPSTPNFNPETMDITFNRTTAAIGNNVVVTVTTSSDVKDLLVNGRIATNKTTSYLTGETTWSFTVPVEDNSSLRVTVVGYDTNGEYTVPYSESVTVINQSGTAEDLLGKLFG